MCSSDLISDAKRAYEPKHDAVLNARQELTDYLKPTDEELEKLQRTTTSKMNKRQIIASLNKIANLFDNNGLFIEANKITKVMTKIAAERHFDFPDEFPMHEHDDDYYNPDKHISFDDNLFNEKDYAGPTKCPECDSDDVMIDHEGNPIYCDNCGWDSETENNEEDF